LSYPRLFMTRLLRRIRHREAVISPQGHFLASLRAHSSTVLRTACGARFRPLDADFASSRRLV